VEIKSGISLLEIVAVLEELAENCCGRSAGTFRKHREMGTSAVGSCYRRTVEDTADREE
jgi:hypothetical protein